MNRAAFLMSLTTVASLAMVACSNSPTATPPAATATATTPAEAAATPGDPAASPGSSAAEPGAAAASASGQGASGPASCAKDTDCAWDDPCSPKRCVAAASAPPTACDRSTPPEGTCVCFDRQCAYRPAAERSPVSVEAACTSPPGCLMDVAAGTCAPGDDPDVRPPGTPGPSCRCDSQEPRRCHYVWVDPVPCASDDDCWVSDGGSPVARPRKLRRKRFRPCKDGSDVPFCESGTCVLRRAAC